MKTSDTQTALIKALCAATKEFRPVVKDRSADRYKYADMSAVHEATTAALAKHGLVIIQGGDGDDIVTRLYHESGEWIETRTPVIAGARLQGAQAYGSGATYARRYALLAILNLSTEDDDGAAASTVAPRRDERSPQHASTASQAPLQAAPEPAIDAARRIAREYVETMANVAEVDVLDAAVDRSRAMLARLEARARDSGGEWVDLHQQCVAARDAAQERLGITSAAVDGWKRAGEVMQ